MSNEENIPIPLEVTVSEDALGVLHISTNSHSALADRNIANQHEIDSITELRTELLGLKNPAVAKSVEGRGYAEYYKWLGGTPSTDKTGYFVSLVQHEDDKMYITPVSASYPNVFGVTISKSSAAFVANDEFTEVKDVRTKVVTGYESIIDASYGLVCLEGAVKVRYASQTLDIKPGDWVKPTDDGRAEKTTSEYGCYLVAGVGVDTIGHYVEINLSLSASDVKKITVNYAILSDNAMNYTENGTIKTKFDEIKGEFDDIKDGTMVVGEATHSVSADDYTETGTIKAKFDEVDDAIADIETGDTIVIRARSDRHNNMIDRTYYSLYRMEEDNPRFINKNHPLFKDLKDLNKFYKPSQCGIYIIHYDTVKEGLIDGLPTDDVFPTTGNGAAIKLIIEADHNNDEFPTVWQTLKVRCGDTNHNKHLIMYHRVCCGIVGTNQNEPVWSDWQRFVSATELEKGNITVKNATNATNATNDENGVSIADNYYCFDGSHWQEIPSGNLRNYITPGNYFISSETLSQKKVTDIPSDVEQNATFYGGARVIVESINNNAYILQRIRFFDAPPYLNSEFTRLLIKEGGYINVLRNWRRYVTEDEISNSANISDISYDTNSQQSTCSIGTILTMKDNRPGTDLVGLPIGELISGIELLRGVDYSFAFYNGTGYESDTLLGGWKILGMCGHDGDGKAFYLIQRIV